MEDIIRIQEITKTYDNCTVVDHLSFSLKSGHILALLGPNGAGKSTTINMISSLIEYDSGEIYYQGEEVRKKRKQFKQEIGVVPQNLAIYEDLTAIQNLRFFAGLYGKTEKECRDVCEEALNFVGLISVKDKKAANYSGGMKRRLNIACSLVNHPKVMIFDEPTVGIDPQSRNYILESIRQLRDKGVSIIYTTHYMEEVEAIAEDVIIMDHGKILMSDTLDNIKRVYADNSTVSVAASSISTDLLQRLEQLEGCTVLERTEDCLKLELDYCKNLKCLNAVCQTFSDSDSAIQSINSNNLNLEDIFLKLTGTKLRE